MPYIAPANFIVGGVIGRGRPYRAASHALPTGLYQAVYQAMATTMTTAKIRRVICPDGFCKMLRSCCPLCIDMAISLFQDAIIPSLDAPALSSRPVR